MPTLNWIGKDKVVNHHMDVPYKILEHQYGFDKGEQSENETNSGNKIIHGDNLEALKSLLPEYEGKIKCIYIDPPYNTGNEGWVYNDNVNDPKIKKWLEKVVGKEGEDLSRHDKWLCMMYPRLKLLHKLLAKDGAIFISIDDNEQANLRLVCDEIFGGRNFINNVIWEKSDSPKMDSQYFTTKHDFILVYAKNKRNFNLKKIQVSADALKHYNKTDDQDRKYYTKPLRAMGGQGETRASRPTLYYPITAPDGSEVYPVRTDRSDGAWRWSKEKLKKNLDRIDWTKGKKGWNPNFRIYATDNATKPPDTIWVHSEVGSNRTSKAEINCILDETNNFNTPKPIALIERVLQLCTDENSIVLDSFAGSGTTAHAVLNFNKQDSGNRKFILIEMEDYAETITAERVKRVTKGYGEDKKAIEGTGGSFDFYELGKSLFLENDILNEEVGLEKIREYVWFSEIRKPYKKANGQEEHLLGKANSSAYYFYYFKDELTTLDDRFLRTIKTKAEQYIIYADNCILDNSLMQKYHIIFKKIPRDITRF
jgi:adenine-specific DNA-methyltransferase